MVTKKQTDFLNKLIETYGKEPLPSYDTICKDLGYKSKNSIWQYFQKLVEEEFIKVQNNRYFLAQNLFGVDYFDQGVRAGFPSPAEDYPVDKISLEQLLIKRPSSTFTVRVVGDSMIEAGIFEDDIAIVDKSHIPRNGDIVIALVDGEYTMKYYKKTATGVVLEPANPDYSTIVPDNELEIFGVVTGIVRSIKK
ncbi:MAG: LexA family protein [Vampirovibrionia bacterium]